MSLSKRSRLSFYDNPGNVIDLISSDEEPVRKRLKSTPPKSNGPKQLKNAKQFKTSSTPVPSSQPRPRNHSTHNQGSTTEPLIKKSPIWKNKPEWRLSNDAPPLSFPSGDRVSERWTDEDESRLRALTITHDGFKFKSTAALKFDPHGDVSVEKERSRDRRDAQKDSSDEKKPKQFPKPQIPPIQHRREQKSNPASNVEIKIPPPSQPSQPSQKLSVNVPLSQLTRLKNERKALRERIKEDWKYAAENPEEIQRVLGLTGLSPSTFPLDLDKKKFENAAQPKKRTVKRRQALLSLGSDEETFKHSRRDAHNLDFVHPSDQARAILTDRFAESFHPSLTFANTVNDRGLNGKFQFVSEYILRKGVKAIGYGGQLGCTCSGSCDMSCACLRKTLKDETSKLERSEQVAHYARRPDGLVVLKDDFIQRYTIQWDKFKDIHLPERVEISECNENCSCDSSCINRVVQKGRTVPLEIFETNRCGFGVRSSQNLVRGQFIELYLGEVITEAELVRREEAAEAGSTSYVYSLDWFSNQQPYHIDGENFGSAMRFVNHSCSPNAGTFTILNNRSTKQLHHVGFFAIKDIPAGVEITIDYTPQAAGQTYELHDADEGMERCFCGASNCRRMLWLPGKERKARKKTIGRKNS